MTDDAIDTSRIPMSRAERRSRVREMRTLHPQLSAEAVELHLRAIEWIRTHETEGFIPKAVAEALLQEIQADRRSRS